MSINNDDAPVLVAVDGTWGSTGAIYFAADEAQRDGRALVLAHVAPAVVPLIPVLPMSEDEIGIVGQQTLDEARALVREHHPDLEVQTMLRIGSRVRHVLELAEASSLVVLGRDLSVPVERVLTGSVSTRVAGRSPRPCAVVPADWKPRADEGPREIVVGLKSLDHADALLSVAYPMASTIQADLRVLHVVHVPDVYADRFLDRGDSTEWLGAVRAQCDELLAPWQTRYPQVSTMLDVVNGRPVHELIGATRSADLLVIGRPARRLGLGSTAHALVLSAAAPVLVVPPGNDEVDDLVLEHDGSLVR